MEPDIPQRLLAATARYLSDLEDPVLMRFLHGVDWRMDARPLAPAPLPCLRHLDRICAIAPGQGSRIVRLLTKSRNTFRWGQTYAEADFGRHFIDNYGWLELFGTRGHFVDNDMAGGFLILGPYVHYPDHHHVAEEIYIPLTAGTAWRKGDGPYVERPAGVPIHHPSDVSHAMKTGEEPLLALYLWRGGPLDARSMITGKVEVS